MLSVQLGDVIISDGVEELFQSCFSGCESLSSVTFGVSSWLKNIGSKAFHKSGLKKLDIPDSIEELCDEYFFMCESVSRVTFAEALRRSGSPERHSICLA